MASPSGPTILWNQLKGKNVKTHDGKDVGEINEVSQNYLRLEKGTLSKDKFWIPKYIVDTFDGKNVWVVANEDEVKERYLFGQEPPNEQFTKDFETFKTTKGRDVYNSEGVPVTTTTSSGHEEESTTAPASAEEYKNIRDLEK